MIISSTLKSVVRSVLKILKPIFLEQFPIHTSWNRSDPSDWPLLKNREKQGIEKYEYSLFSQNGEDGIIRYLFSEIGFSSKTFLEFGFGITENNTLRLVLKEGFSGVFIDGARSSVKAFNKAMQKTGVANVKAIQQFLNLENLKSTILEGSLPEEIDLLSIDVDGNDYWFWKDISYLSPRVVVIEYNASLGPALSLTVPYDPHFDRHAKHFSGFYHGASLAAFAKLGGEKGYALVGCESNGVNVFFVRRDCLTRRIKELSPLTAYRPHKKRLISGVSVEEQFRIIKDMPYSNVE